MSELKFSKEEKRTLVKLRNAAYEAELSELLQPLQGRFEEWDRGEVEAVSLAEEIRDLCRNELRELDSRYDTLDASLIVARAAAHGILEDPEISDSLRGKLQRMIEYFREQ